MTYFFLKDCNDTWLLRSKSLVEYVPGGEKVSKKNFNAASFCLLYPAFAPGNGKGVLR